MHKLLTTTLAAALLALPALTSPPAQASIAQPELAPTPYMGWNTYYGLGGQFTEAGVLEEARALKDKGLAAAGYDIVWLDGGWQAATPRDAAGNLTADPARFPHGLAWLTEQLHAMGLRAGIYTDAGPYDASVCGLGSFGHQQRDADQFAEWGFDAVKVDFVCGYGARMMPEPAMRAMVEAIRSNASDRPMIINICNPITKEWGEFPPEMQATNTYTYAPEIAESWRTYTDVGFNGKILFPDVLRNYDANAAHPEAAGPGHWNDPDYLGPQLGMTDTEFRTQMSLWSVAAAPLIIGSDIRTLTATSIATLTDPEVLAINQDRLGDQAERVGPSGMRETWVKELADGSKAVLLLNRGNAPATVETTVASIGLKGARVSVLDTWTNDRTEASKTLRETVPAHGASLLRVARSTGKPGDSRLTTGTPQVRQVDGLAIAPTAEALVAPGSTFVATMTISNDGVQPITGAQVALELPKGFTGTVDGLPARLHPGASATVTVTVTVPADAKPGSHSVGVRTTSSGSTVVGSIPVVVAPAPPTGTANLAQHPWLSGTSGWMQPTINASVGGWTPLVVAGTTYQTGIGVASPSDIRWYLGGQCSRLSGAVGIDDAVKFGAEGGTAEFSVVGDGTTLWTSGVVRRDQLVTFDADVTGVRDLHLLVGDAKDGGYNDRADWINLQVDCQG